MKLTVLLAAFVSFSAVASCPNLAGTYSTCVSSSGEISTLSSISQTNSGGVTVYTITAINEETGAEEKQVIAADGIPQSSSTTDPDSGMVIESTQTASCNNNALIADASFSVDSQAIGDLKLTYTKSGTVLKGVVEGTIFGQEVNETITCE